MRRSNIQTKMVNGFVVKIFADVGSQSVDALGFYVVNFANI